MELFFAIQGDLHTVFWRGSNCSFTALAVLWLFCPALQSCNVQEMNVQKYSSSGFGCRERYFVVDLLGFFSTGQINEYTLNEDTMERLCYLSLVGHRETYSICYGIHTTTKLRCEATDQLGTFHIGFRSCNRTDISIHFDFSEKHSGFHISYGWYRNTVPKAESIFASSQNSPVLIESLVSKFSWSSATRKCSKRGLTLPTFQSEASTKQFVSLIHNRFCTPVYGTFIGLVQKVGTFVCEALCTLFQFNNSADSEKPGSLAKPGLLLPDNN